MQQASVLSCVKHGIGDEITYVGSLVSALLQDGYRIKIVTHHPILYQHDRIHVASWNVTDPLEDVTDDGELRVCFDNPGAGSLPLQFDVTPTVVEKCRRLGYTLIGRMTRPGGVVEGGAYEFASRVNASLGLGMAEPPWLFLRRPCSGYVLLNPFGNDSLSKGMSPELAWPVLRGVLKANPHRPFTLPLLTKMPLPPPNLSSHSNLKIEWFEHGDPALLERYLRAASVITAEGGGYHLAKAAGIPALLVTSRQWHLRTRLVLPPGPSEMLLFEQDSDVVPEVLRAVRTWIDRHPS